MKCFIYRTVDVKSSKLWTHKWPAVNVSGFIAKLLRASHLYREVTCSNPVEVLTFSGFYIRYCINAFITMRIIASLIHLCVMLKSLHLNFIYIPTICFAVEVCLIFSTHTLLFPITWPCAPVNLLSVWDKIQWLWYVLDSKSSAFTNLFFRLVKVVQSYFTLIHIVSQDSLLDLKEKWRKRQQPDTHLELALYGYQPISFFVTLLYIAAVY